MKGDVVGSHRLRSPLEGALGLSAGASSAWAAKKVACSTAAATSSARRARRGMLGPHTRCPLSIANLPSIGPAVIYFSTRARRINSESTPVLLTRRRENLVRPMAEPAVFWDNTVSVVTAGDQSRD